MVCAKAATLIGDAAGKVGTGGGGGRGGANRAGNTGQASTRGAIGIPGGASAGVESAIWPGGLRGERILGQVRRRLHSR